MEHNSMSSGSGPPVPRWEDAPADVFVHIARHLDPVSIVALCSTCSSNNLRSGCNSPLLWLDLQKKFNITTEDQSLLRREVCCAAMARYNAEKGLYRTECVFIAAQPSSESNYAFSSIYLQADAFDEDAIVTLFNSEYAGSYSSVSLKERVVVSLKTGAFPHRKFEIVTPNPYSRYLLINLGEHIIGVATDFGYSTYQWNKVKFKIFARENDSAKFEALVEGPSPMNVRINTTCIRNRDPTKHRFLLITSEDGESIAHVYDTKKHEKLYQFSVPPIYDQSYLIPNCYHGDTFLWWANSHLHIYRLDSPSTNDPSDPPCLKVHLGENAIFNPAIATDGKEAILVTVSTDVVQINPDNFESSALHLVDIETGTVRRTQYLAQTPYQHSGSRLILVAMDDPHIYLVLQSTVIVFERPSLKYINEFKLDNEQYQDFSGAQLVSIGQLALWSRTKILMLQLDQYLANTRTGLLVDPDKRDGVSAQQFSEGTWSQHVASILQFPEAGLLISTIKLTDSPDVRFAIIHSRWDVENTQYHHSMRLPRQTVALINPQIVPSSPTLYDKSALPAPVVQMDAGNSCLYQAATQKRAKMRHRGQANSLTSNNQAFVFGAFFVIKFVRNSKGAFVMSSTTQEEFQTLVTDAL